MRRRSAPSVKNRHFRSVPGPGNARDDRPGTHPSATSPGPIATHRPENGCGSAIDRTILRGTSGRLRQRRPGVRSEARCSVAAESGIPSRLAKGVVSPERSKRLGRGSYFPGQATGRSCTSADEKTIAVLVIAPPLWRGSMGACHGMASTLSEETAASCRASLSRCRLADSPASQACPDVPFTHASRSCTTVPLTSVSR